MNTEELLSEVRKEIKSLEKIATLLGGRASKSTKPRKKRKPMSEETKAKIAAARKAAWAKKRKG
jgi:hypothetical protein